MEQLNAFKKLIDREIGDFFDRTIADFKKKDRVMAEALRYVRKMTLAQGKRVRPAMLYYGYWAVGGKDKKKILRAAVSIELVHIFLLIHDDIVDRGEKRHGVDTVHRWFERNGKRLFRNTDHQHFGNSMAIVVGDLIQALGNQILYQSGFPDAAVVRALNKLQDIVAFTVIGEAKDIYIEYRGRATEREILKMYEYKTARYTFEGPLHLGAILGGGNVQALKALTDYSIPLGIAFQIQDDILGIFGSEKKMGKSAASDIEEGKQTILVAQALKSASREQQKRLLAILGKKNLSREEIGDFQQIIRGSGALDYAREMASRHIRLSQEAIRKSRIDEEAKLFLMDVAEHMLGREV